MRTGSVLFLLGTMLLCRLPELPPVAVSILPLLLIVPAIRYVSLRRLLWFLCGFFWAMIRAEIILTDKLEKDLEGLQLQVEGRVASLPVYRDSVVRFDFKPDKMTDGRGNGVQSPEKIRLNWYRNYPDIIPGDKWRFYVKLKRPWGYMNPGGFDYEGFLFRENIGATGYVVGRKSGVRLDAPDRLNINYLRFHVRETLGRLLGNRPLNSLVTALVTGDRSAITPEQWDILTRSGTNHLLAISGLHIGLVAGLAFLITCRLWPLLGVISYRVSGPRIAAVNAVFVALLYAALAGFSVPTQRALMMLATVLLLTFMNRKTRPTNIIALVLVLILIIDPFSVMSAGFWLSFLAILVIIFGMTCRTAVTSVWWKWGRVQYVVAIGLVPVLVLWFQQIPLLSIPANLIAVPWVSMLTVPLVLAGTFCSYISESAGLILLKAGVYTLELLWKFLELATSIDSAVLQTAPPPIAVVIAASFGVTLLLLPEGLPGRWLGIIWLLPICLRPVDNHIPGEIRATLLDVGQGLAVVVRTKNHTLLYDTGPKFSDRFDAGSDIILPNLKYQGINRLDVLVASHGDSDHIGGLPALLENLDVRRIITSVPEMTGRADAENCRSGDSWRWDGVKFKLLHPEADDDLTGNNLSCVLKININNHALLLTGDIERQAEYKLVSRSGKELRSDVLIAPHHGSGTSSTTPFIKAVQPVYVLFPAGYRNRFNFPKQDIIDRYRSRGVIPLNTAASGAIEIDIDENRINIVQNRQRLHRFWTTEF